MSTELEKMVEDPRWILECGCDSMAEHCDQCDGRREIRAIIRREVAVRKAWETIRA